MFVGLSADDSVHVPSRASHQQYTTSTDLKAVDFDILGLHEPRCGHNLPLHFLLKLCSVNCLLTACFGLFRLPEPDPRAGSTHEAPSAQQPEPPAAASTPRVGSLPPASWAERLTSCWQLMLSTCLLLFLSVSMSCSVHRLSPVGHLRSQACLQAAEPEQDGGPAFQALSDSRASALAGAAVASAARPSPVPGWPRAPPPAAQVAVGASPAAAMAGIGLRASDSRTISSASFESDEVPSARPA